MLNTCKQLEEIFIKPKTDDQADNERDDQIDDETNDKVDEEPDTTDMCDLESEEYSKKEEIK